MSDPLFPQNQIPNDPSLKDLLDLYRKDILLSLMCHHIGTIQSFDAGKQTASATINYKKTIYPLDAVTGLYSPTLIDYPQMTDCPVIVLGGGKASLTFPIVKGDECFVLFNDRDIDKWFSGGSGAGVASNRLHSFSDAIVIVGLRSLNNVLKNYDTTRAVLGNDKAMVAVGASLVKIANDQYDLKTILKDLVTQVGKVIDAVNTTPFILVTASPGAPSPANPAVAAALAPVTAELSTISSNLDGLLE